MREGLRMEAGKFEECLSLYMTAEKVTIYIYNVCVCEREIVDWT